MTELILKKLDRGFILKDFDGNEIGIRDSEQAIEEIKILIKPDEKHIIYTIEKPIIDITDQMEKPIIDITDQMEKPIIDITDQIEKPIIDKYVQKKKRYNDHVELRKDILEKAKEQISMVGNVNESKISKELGISNSILHIHLKIMRPILDDLMLSLEKG